MSLQKTVQKIKANEINATELCEQSLKKIQEENPDLNAVLHINESFEEQLKKAKGRLAGIPIIVKDNFCVKDFKTTAASKILNNFISPYTAHCIQKLQDEGAIVIAKANMDEFAMGSSNENSAFGSCKNPWNKEYVPGGSSGGSAASVAAGFSALAIGSDTGGSIRQPASFCGVVGVKPSYGSISRYGMIAFASSLDQAGPMTQSVDDAALALDIMIDKDPRDGTNVSCDFDFFKEPRKQFKVGVPKEYLEADLSSDLRNSLNNLIKELKNSGHEVVDVELPHTKYAIPVYYLVSASEASSNLSRYDGVRYGLRDIELESGQRVNQLKDFYKLTRSRGFGEEVKRRILLGTFSLSSGYYDAYYTKACQVRRLIANDFKAAFEKCDVIIGPVSTDSAFKIGEKVNDPIAMYYNDILTTPASLAGLPSMSLPMALDSKKMPLGLQIIAGSFQDDKMIEFARVVENMVDFKEKSNV